MFFMVFYLMSEFGLFPKSDTVYVKSEIDQL